jgi:hypothetical protein
MTHMRDMEQRGRRRVVMPRVGRSVVTWGMIGGTAGLILGILIGLAFTTPGRFGFWMAVVGATVFLGAVCAFTAGIASLGAPPPGGEPSDADMPSPER